MHIDWIHTYIDLLESHNFNLTAENLGITQSTVSHRVQKLEQSLGQQLFIRGRNGALPTRHGRNFETYARNLLREWTLAKHKVSIDPATGGEIRLGIQYDVAKCFAGEIIKSLRRTFPNARIYTEIDYSTQMCQDVLIGNHDAGLIFTPIISPDLYVKEFTQMNYFMVGAKEADLQTISTESYIFPNYSPMFSSEHRAAFPNLTNCQLTSGNADSITQFLDSLGGASYLPETALNPKIHHKILGAPVFTQQVYFCCHNKNRHTKNMQNMFSAMQRAFA